MDPPLRFGYGCDIQPPLSVLGPVEQVLYGKGGLPSTRLSGYQGNRWKRETPHAHVIKTWYTGDPKTFEQVTAVAPGKVVAAGGPKTDTDQQLLEMVKEVMDAGALGLAFGRNVWGHPNPVGIIRAIKAVIHENNSVKEAMEILGHPQ